VQAPRPSVLIAAPSVPFFTSVSRFVAEYELGAEIATAAPPMR